ncbi:MAG: phosphatase PAP2 family protein [Candidatus Marinimicrobia bacterium]|nr:phosphatase PAP2 family protein [Candidatus Neomarinimicrobiota bacterium]
MQKTAFFLSLLLLFTSLSATDWRALDTSLSLSLQGSNNYPHADYLFESVSLLTPAVEVGNAFYFRLDADTDSFQSIAITLISTQVLTAGLKYLIGRPRPVRTYQPRMWNTRITPSFPSGHTASSAAYATLISLQYPRYTPLMAGFALLSCYSQIYVGNHYVSDVMAGMLLGGLVGYLVNEIVAEDAWSKTTGEPGLARIRIGHVF